jgi:tRNA(Ile2) C34 agmatinyltransferase TiaS
MGRLIDIDRLCDDLAKRWSIADKKKEDLVRAVMADVVTPIVVSQPIVDAVPVRHGRWIDIDSETYTWKIRCSKCGHERSMMSTGQTYPMYCEDCGARMDGKDGEWGE